MNDHAPKDENMQVEVENRLEALFGDEDKPLASGASNKEVDNSPLTELKALVLSIDWEISDEAMGRFLEQVNLLKKTFHNAQTELLLLKMLGVLGKYIKHRQSKSHPDAIKLLNSAYASLEKIVQTPDLADDQRRELLMSQVKCFNELKERIGVKPASGRSTPLPASSTHETGVHSSQSAVAGSAATVDVSAMREEILGAVMEIKLILRTELQDIKQQLTRIEEALQTSE